ncbi:hypothetical protein BN1184_AR_00040 [Pantoea ananatis]|nr:hypothetical protein BN1184_AR_00040 [Pantoea ananatis]
MQKREALEVCKRATAKGKSCVDGTARQRKRRASSRKMAPSGLQPEGGIND